MTVEIEFREYTSELEWLPRTDTGANLQRIDVQFIPRGRLYSYAWSGPETLEVGDMLRAPRPPSWNGPYFGLCRVINLRSGYEGPIRTISEFVRRLGPL